MMMWLHSEVTGSKRTVFKAGYHGDGVVMNVIDPWGTLFLRRRLYWLARLAGVNTKSQQNSIIALKQSPVPEHIDGKPFETCVIFGRHRRCSGCAVLGEPIRIGE